MRIRDKDLKRIEDRAVLMHSEHGREVKQLIAELQVLREAIREAKRANNERTAYADDVLNEKIREWEEL